MHPIGGRYLRLSGFKPGVDITVREDYQTSIAGVNFKRYRHKDRNVPKERHGDRRRRFQKGFDATFGAGAVLPAVNVVTPKQFKVEMPSVSIKVDPKQADLLETRVIDGRSYLLIPIDGDIAVNGQPVFATK